MAPKYSLSRLLSIIAIAGTLLPSGAEAYLGPGAGLSAIGSLLALIVAAFVGVIGFIWYPIKRVLRHFRSRQRRQPPQVGAVAEGREP